MGGAHTVLALETFGRAARHQRELGLNFPVRCFPDLFSGSIGWNCVGLWDLPSLHMHLHSYGLRSWPSSFFLLV